MPDYQSKSSKWLERASGSHRRVVSAPNPSDPSVVTSVINVELDNDEDVVWEWTHEPGGRSKVTGYRIVKKGET